MRKKSKTGKLSILMAAACCLLVGCDSAVLQSSQPVPEPETNAARFDSPGETLTPIESALILSEKYAALAVDMEKTRTENRALLAENNELRQRLATVRAELDQTARELADANEMLVDMRVELNNWRHNVLGFREEMMQAQQAQLEALLKIMTLLGGELPPDPND